MLRIVTVACSASNGTSFPPSKISGGNGKERQKDDKSQSSGQVAEKQCLLDGPDSCSHELATAADACTRPVEIRTVSIPANVKGPIRLQPDLKAIDSWEMEISCLQGCGLSLIALPLENDASFTHTGIAILELTGLLKKKKRI